MTKKDENFRCGMVSIVGRPNVGKSTLFNTILGQKVAIVSKIPQTTRNQIRAIYNDERGQIVFIDTPGLHLGKDKLDEFMNEASLESMHDVDCIIYLVDTSRKIGEEEENLARKLKSLKTPIVLGLNKVDLGGDNVPSYISFWERVKGKSVQEMDNFTLIALSGKKEININDLLDILFGYLPRSEAYYPADTVSDVPQRLSISDIIREKLLMHVREEIPHSLGVVIEEMKSRKKNTLFIRALILVERETQKEIVIGKKGALIKKVGVLAREELERLLDEKVFLELQVKTHKNWRDKEDVLSQIGYTY